MFLLNPFWARAFVLPAWVARSVGFLFSRVAVGQARDTGDTFLVIHARHTHLVSRRRSFSPLGNRKYPGAPPNVLRNTGRRPLADEISISGLWCVELDERQGYDVQMIFPLDESPSREVVSIIPPPFANTI